MIKRRKLLKLAGMAGVALSLPVSAVAQTIRTTSLGAGLSLITGAGANVVVAVGPKSVVVVDGGLKAHGEALLVEINRLAEGKPISSLFNTNWRPEHTGLNHLVGDTTDIIAHENTRLWQEADFYVDWEDKTYPSMSKQTQANKTFYKTGLITLGDEVIEYGTLGQAHTDGDIYIHFTQADVLVVGDALAVDEFPLLDYVTGGWIGGIQNATKNLIERCGENTKVIAAGGGVHSKADLEAQGKMLQVAYDSVAKAFQTGRSLKEFTASAPMADYESSLGDASLFLTLLYQGTWYHIPGRAVRLIV